MTWIKIAQLTISLLLIVSVLLQSRGSGLGGAFGGSGAVYMSKRGIEKKLFIITIVLSVLFFIVSFLNVFLKL